MDKWYKTGAKFGCKRCSCCCGKSPGYVFLSKSDRKRLADYLKISEEEFIEKYCRRTTYYHGYEVYALIEMKNFDCILWNNGCTCYEARPVQCSTYPFWPWIMEDKKTWDSMKEDCPGIDQGELWPQEYIDRQIALYEANELEIREDKLNEDSILQ